MTNPQSSFRSRTGVKISNQYPIVVKRSNNHKSSERELQTQAGRGVTKSNNKTNKQVNDNERLLYPMQSTYYTKTPQEPFPISPGKIQEETCHSHDTRDAIEERGFDNEQSIDEESKDFPVDEQLPLLPDEKHVLKRSPTRPAHAVSTNERRTTAKRNLPGQFSPKHDDEFKKSTNSTSYMKRQVWPQSVPYNEEDIDLQSSAGDSSLNESPILQSNTTASEETNHSGSFSSLRSRPLSPEIIEDSIFERRPHHQPRRGMQLDDHNNRRIVSPEPKAKEDDAADCILHVNSNATEEEEAGQCLLDSGGSSTYDSRQNEACNNAKCIPKSRIQGIIKFYGPGCDLYRDVLSVDREATDSQIRVAYFRRGREVLAEAEGRDKKSPPKTTKGNNSAKAEFHAVTLAYEIASRYEWRALYDKYGWNQEVVTLPEQEQQTTQEIQPPIEANQQMNETRVESPPRTLPELASILRPGARSYGRKNESSERRTVQWSEEVEELIFERLPEEIADDDDSRSEFSEEESVDSNSTGPSANESEPSTPANGEEDHDNKKPGRSFINMFFSDLDTSLNGLEVSLSGIIRGSPPRKENSSSHNADESTNSPSRKPDDQQGKSNRVGTETSVHNKFEESRKGQFSPFANTDGSGTDTPDTSTGNQTATNPTGRPTKNKVRSAEQLAEENKTADELFQSLTKPLPRMNFQETEKSRLRKRFNGSVSSTEQKAYTASDDGWDTTQVVPVGVKCRVKSRDFEDAFDPFADISPVKGAVFDEIHEQQRPRSTEGRIVAGIVGGGGGIESSDMSVEFSGAASLPDSVSNAGFETSPVNLSIDTGVLDSKCPCRVSLLPVTATKNADQAETPLTLQAARAEGTPQTKLPEHRGRAPPHATADQNFFSDWVTYMGRMSEDLSAIGSHMTKNANEMVNSTQQVFASTFYLPEDEVDKVLNAVSMGFTQDDAEVSRNGNDANTKPAVPRSNTY